jgi:hypothetical protein
MICLSTTFVVFPLVSKLWITWKPTWDDLVACIAWAFAAGLSAKIMFATTVGLGTVDEDISNNERKALWVHSV